MRVNLDLLRQRAQEIRNGLAALSRYGALSQGEFVASQQVVDAAKYRLLVTIEAAISICTHLASRLAQRTPDSYSQCFEVLASADIISPQIAERLGHMARFRNLLVHVYGEVDDGRVWAVIQHDLRDVETYLLEVGNHLKEQLT